MAQEKRKTENRANHENTLKDVVVELPKTNVITNQTILQSLRRENRSAFFTCILMSVFLFCPILFCVFAYNETFLWYYFIFPVICFLLGIKLVHSTVSDFIKTHQRKAYILKGAYMIRKSSILDDYSEYNSPGECDDYFVRTIHTPECWVKVPKPVYFTATREKICYILYLQEKGKYVPFLIYFGNCTFDKSIS